MKFSKEFFISVLILIGAGIFFQMMSYGEEVPTRKSFAEFPTIIEQWQGKELGIDPEILKVLKVDDYMMRLYRNAEGFPIYLYVGYYQSQRQGATYHSPKNCLPGSGWFFVESEQTDLTIHHSPQNKVTINKVIIQKGLDKQLILYWYQDRGRIIASEYWAKIYLVWDAITKNRTDGAFVRISAPIGNSVEETFQEEMRFAQRVFPFLFDYLPQQESHPL